MIVKTKIDQKTELTSQSGNILFLILIAVALFAALSYAVTQTTGPGNNSKEETSLISGAQVSQYPSIIKTALVRMSVSKNLDHDEIYFNRPSGGDYTGINDDPDNHANPERFVFHPSGGGVTYQSPADSVLTADGDEWYFSALQAIQDVGSTRPDVVAYLPGIAKSVCESINSKLGIDTMPVHNDHALSVFQSNIGPSLDEISLLDTPAATNIIGDEASEALLAGKTAGCFETTDTKYVYYQTLIER